MYFDVVDEGLNVCQLFNEVCVYKSLIKTICENRKKNYIVAIAKCQLNEGKKSDEQIRSVESRLQRCRNLAKK